MIKVPAILYVSKKMTYLQLLKRLTKQPLRILNRQNVVLCRDIDNPKECRMLLKLKYSKHGVMYLAPEIKEEKE